MLIFVPSPPSSAKVKLIGVATPGPVISKYSEGSAKADTGAIGDNEKTNSNSVNIISRDFPEPFI